ncbi:hypothetical protein MRB53_006081 [Persea americana]|uniref:Uncharacterized protein n=1 Tax=Persea americana TaxID=3435 RepID=A0ACC2MFF0_PERAE|nr:hypothetical protein MRB53_006081 [Persea americana]
MTHFEMSVACLKNGLLRNSKDYIEEKEEIYYLKLAKPEEEKKMAWKYSWDLQENGSNGFLVLKGRRGYNQFFGLKFSTLGMQGEERRGRRRTLS